MSQKRSFSDFVTYAQNETSWRIVWSCMKCQNLWDAPALISCISKEWVMFFVGDNFKSVRYFEAHLKLCIIDEGNCQGSEKGGTKLTRHSSQISKVASKIHVRRARSSPKIYIKQWLLWGLLSVCERWWSAKHGWLDCVMAILCRWPIVVFLPIGSVINILRKY